MTIRFRPNGIEIESSSWEDIIITHDLWRMEKENKRIVSNSDDYSETINAEMMRCLWTNARVKMYKIILLHLISIKILFHMRVREIVKDAII